MVRSASEIPLQQVHAHEDINRTKGTEKAKRKQGFRKLIWRNRCRCTSSSALEEQCVWRAETGAYKQYVRISSTTRRSYPTAKQMYSDTSITHRRSSLQADPPDRHKSPAVRQWYPGQLSTSLVRVLRAYDLLCS